MSDAWGGPGRQWSGPLWSGATRGNRTENRLNLEEIEKIHKHNPTTAIGLVAVFYLYSPGPPPKGNMYLAYDPRYSEQYFVGVAPCKWSPAKPYRFIGFGAMDVTKPYEFIGFVGRVEPGLGTGRSLKVDPVGTGRT